MTKIKNFRIALRPREVARILKSSQQVQITPALEASIDHSLGDSKRWLQPAALYTTLPRAAAEKTLSLPIDAAAVAVSVIAVMVGSGFIEKRQESLDKNEVLQAAVWDALQQEALQQAAQFAARLIQEQAREEECELTPSSIVTEDSQIRALATLLGVSRIGVDLTASGWPSSARVTWLAWMPIAPKNTSKRGEPAARPVKAAV